MSRALPVGYAVTESNPPRCKKCGEPQEEVDWKLIGPGGLDLPLVSTSPMKSRSVAVRMAVDVLKARGVIQ